MQSDFYRIGRLPPYVFAEVNKIKAEARAKGHDIIDFGMGNPDSKPPEHVIAKLKEVIDDPKSGRYSQSKGVFGLRKALVGYYKRRFNVQLDPDKEVCVTIGSKEGLANLANAISQPGDVFLVPNPSYPIHTWGFVIPGAEVRHIPNLPHSPEFFENVKRALEMKPKPIAMVVNYPCNPTADTVDLGFYEELVKLCTHYGVYIISDLAYCELYFDKPTPSILQVPGAKEIAIEFTTVSKTYSMAGWRIGFAAGNPALIGALTKIKSYLDYGTFLPVQVAAAAALNGPQDYVDTMRELYKNRRDVLVDGLLDAGWNVARPNASMFVWAKLPEKYLSLGSLEFSKLLLTEADVAVAPGIGFGEMGDDHVRFALVENRQRIRQACRNIKTFLQAKPAKPAKPKKAAKS